MLCTQCLTVGKPVTDVKGSILMEIVLWLCFLIPGLIYSMWRLTTKTKVCKQCKSPDMIPEDSPRAKKLIAE